jgi:hypothetical protein
MLNNAATAALIAATTAGKALVDDDCAKKRSPSSLATDTSVKQPYQPHWGEDDHGDHPCQNPFEDILGLPASSAYSMTTN